MIAREEAFHFCIMEGSKFGFKLETAYDCVAPVVSALEQSMNGEVVENITFHELAEDEVIEEEEKLPATETPKRVRGAVISCVLFVFLYSCASKRCE